MRVRAAGRVGLEPARDRSGLLIESLFSVSNVGSNHKVGAEEVANLGQVGVLGSGGIRVDSRDDEGLVTLSVVANGKLRRTNSSYKREEREWAG